MNKVLIVSDSHGLTTELNMIKKRHQVDQLIHCGDSELDDNASELSRFVTVKGNCDWQAYFPEEKIIDLGGLRFYITHGHLYNVKNTLLTVSYRAQEHGANVVCFGHTHIPFAQKINSQLFINPGSIRSPKKFKEPSYAILEWLESSLISINFYHLDGNVITNFPYENKFTF